MAANTPYRRDIETRLLEVDLGNFRIGDQDNPRAAYQAMIEQEGEDLARLGADIVENGLSMAISFMVCPDPETPKHFIVCDGNRRFTAMKLMEKPILADGTAVAKRFNALAKEYAKNPIRKVSTVVYADKEQAMPWIRRLHQDMGGIGMAQWKGHATARADEFGGRVRASRAVMNLAKQHNVLPASTEAVLVGRTTNLDRVLQMPYMKRALGVSIEKDGAVTFENGNVSAGVNLLQRMLKAMAHKDFDVNKIRSLEQRQNFIDEFSAYGVRAPEPTDGGGNRKPAGAAAKTSTKKAARKAAPPSERKTLALKGRSNELPVHEARLSELYAEALRIPVKSLPNCASMLTRVFLELATDHLLETLKVPLPAKHVTKGVKRWRDKGVSLEEKLNTALKQVDPTGRDPDFAQARKFNDPKAIHAVAALHDFMHNLKSNPSESEIKQIWQRWHTYFEAVFDRAP